MLLLNLPGRGIRVMVNVKPLLVLYHLQKRFNIDFTAILANKNKFKNIMCKKFGNRKYFMVVCSRSRDQALCSVPPFPKKVRKFTFLGVISLKKFNLIHLSKIVIVLDYESSGKNAEVKMSLIKKFALIFKICLKIKLKKLKKIIKKICLKFLFG